MPYGVASANPNEDRASDTWEDRHAPERAPARPVQAEYDLTRLVVASIAALLFAIAGLQMVTMRSVSGESLAEAFYHAVGFMAFGLAALSIAVGLRKS